MLRTYSKLRKGEALLFSLYFGYCSASNTWKQVTTRCNGTHVPYVNLVNSFLTSLLFLNSLVGVLTRFRKEEVAFSCDVEQMFHSFYVNPEHRDFLRFLWFEDNNLNKPIVEFRMKVHLFGAASSPGVANFCLRQTGESKQQQYGDEAVDFLKRDYYVDDGLTSVPTVEKAVELILEVTRDVRK